MRDYEHLEIEKKWQSTWAKKKAYKTKISGKKYYVLDMFPYPSGAGLHVGHPKGYIGSDVFARFKRMQGFNVLHPMGYDAFGLPAEQYALEHNISPRKAVLKNVETFENQLSIIGLSYDWERKVNTTDPGFYRFTQWIFLKIYNSWYGSINSPHATKEGVVKKARPISELIKIFEKSGSGGINAVSDPVVPFSAEEWKAKSKKEKQDTLMKYRLAYEGYSEVNWCEVLGTVLANDEVVDSPKGPVSERGGYPVVKKQMRQWFMRITAYADRLLSGLEGLNWSEHIKEIQRNWIGKSEGAEINFQIVFKHGQRPGSIPVFTTRADTIFGATFLVLSPEHLWVTLAVDDDHVGVLDNQEEVKKYLASVKNKSIEERVDGAKEKTGIELKGVKAINPANGEEIPVWVADFVLAHYGTGAVFGDAHDQRDFEFAKKYHIPLKEVVIPRTVDKHDPPREGVRTVERRAIQAIVINPKNKKTLVLKWKKFPWTTFVTGGIEGDEDIVEAAQREIVEETGYQNVKFVRYLGGPIESHFYASHKGENRKALFFDLVFELQDEKRKEISPEEKEKHEAHWVSWEELNKDTNIKNSEYEIILDRFFNPPHAWTEEGVLIDSGKFSGMRTEDARKEIIRYVGGKIVSKYKMRDAIFARQRYWGEPIPLWVDKEGIIHEVSEKKLPLKLPEIKSYSITGTGESPLANVRQWKKKGYETNTMPGWAGSSWYFLRYMDPKNKKVFASKKAISYWKNVDMYIGGAEHATGHLLYSRFWHKVLKDYGLVPTEEPFLTLKNQGMILGSDNRKMSKRWGNVINPNEIVKTYGADTLRVYEMFMGPFENSLPWSTDNIIGSRRFLDRVWRVVEKISSLPKSKANSTPKLEALLHQTVQKVTEDIQNFAFNTAVSSMMILLNEIESTFATGGGISKKDFEMFIKILSPFAPHITEELWHTLGHKSLLVSEKWPRVNMEKMKDVEITIVVQVNSKVRAEFLVERGSKEADVVETAKGLDSIGKWLLGKEIKKVIYVPNKLVNIVTN
jgi:leucyl-tRNA synthetase